ncbi:MAG: hypothetical protein E5X80_15225 [Mesorhizobium sp.]|uniref:hypothetical protein n=1 Tax=Mesorhizobium sp. TaxID=1871066 RepID=UPI0011FDF8C9|nr:hypothetical protein [Mesorhizobium sp.]TIO51047.1 MAG: hypothetical protein E5X78_18470 [Mesorhizobium sp.]TIO60168.1 MAG: hypothetical protein E5X79_13670 [Mesorhizobium sp.]TJV63776.1 MAG: hypothetical protein E5X80_15225 [Mesorhizobium sp.]
MDARPALPGDLTGCPNVKQPSLQIYVAGEPVRLSAIDSMSQRHFRLFAPLAILDQNFGPGRTQARCSQPFARQFGRDFNRRK